MVQLHYDHQFLCMYSQVLQITMPFLCAPQPSKYTDISITKKYVQALSGKGYQCGAIKAQMIPLSHSGSQ